MAALGFLALAAAFALASWIGWWTVPVLAVIWGWLNPARPDAEPRAPSAERRATLTAALAAPTAWAIWFGVDALAGGLGRLGPRLAGVVGQPLPVLVAATLLFPVLLAATAALVGSRLAGLLRSGRPLTLRGNRAEFPLSPEE